MSIIINLFLMAYLLVMVILSIVTLFWATLLIFKPVSTNSGSSYKHSAGAIGLR